MTTDDWDDAPAASEPTQPVTDRTPVVPTPAQADEWGDVSFVADFPDEVSQDPDYQPLQSPDTWDENDTALAAGYQQLAQDPEWNDIEAQRRAARALHLTENTPIAAPAPWVEETAASPVAATWETPAPVPAPAASAPAQPPVPPVAIPVPTTTTPGETTTPTPGAVTVPGVALPPVAEPVAPLFPPTAPVAVIPVVPAPTAPTPVVVLPEAVAAAQPTIQVPVPTDTAPTPVVAHPTVPSPVIDENDAWGDAPTAFHPDQAPSTLDEDDWSDAPAAGTGVPSQPVRDLDDIADGLRQAAGLAMPSITPVRPRGEDQVPAAGAPVIAMGLPLLPDDTPDEESLPDLDVDPEEEDLEATGHVLVPQTKKGTPEPAAPSSGKGKKKTRNGNTIGGIRLTARDMKILGFLARYRVATVGQLARRFETSETALRNRLPGLERAGLLSWAWAAQTKPKVWLITDAGLATVGMNLTVPTVRWGQLRHTLGLVDLGIAFELAGETVLTEREVRAAATRYTPTARMRTAIDFFRTVESIEEGIDPTVARVRTALTVPVPSRGGFGHIPDMVLARQPYPNGASGSIAVELELTRKGLSDWKMIVSAYRDSNVFSEVYYYVMSSDIKRGLEGVIKALGASQKIQVVAFTPIDLTADPGVTGGGA